MAERFARETVVTDESSELLTRLERQSAESGRLEGRVETLERAVQTERDARRRLTATIKRERTAAAAIHARAEASDTEVAEARAEVERLTAALAESDQQVQIVWAQLKQVEAQLAWKSRSLWQKLLRRPPAQ